MSRYEPLSKASSNGGAGTSDSDEEWEKKAKKRSYVKDEDRGGRRNETFRRKKISKHSVLRWTRSKVHDRFRATDYWRDESAAHSPGLPSDAQRDRDSGQNDSDKKVITLRKLWSRLQTVTLLLLLGVLVALITFSVDKLVSLLERSRDSILHLGGNADSGVVAGGVMLYMILSLALSWLAVILVRFVPMAAGSGIPRMKSLFSGGVYFHYFLSWRTLFVKIAGLTCAYSAGLTVGKEGPFVHISACVATLLTRYRIFSRYSNVSRLR